MMKMKDQSGATRCGLRYLSCDVSPGRFTQSNIEGDHVDIMSIRLSSSVRFKLRSSIGAFGSNFALNLLRAKLLPKAPIGTRIGTRKMIIGE